MLAELERNLLKIGSDLRVEEVIRGRANIALFSDANVNWDLSQEWQAGLLGVLSRSAFAENVISLVAVRAEEAAHVFNDANHWNFDLSKHRDGFDRVDQRDFLRRTDDHRSGNWENLREGQRHVAGAWWHVDD